MSLRSIMPIAKGWRAALKLFAISESLVLILNLSFAIWAIASAHQTENGSIVLYEGLCSTVQSLNTGVHLCINILSIVLLGGSNYAMQCLSAPTRADVDAAHKEQEWLDIGVPSIRNLRRSSRAKRVIWGLLCVSSLPLHLFYNSVVFASISSTAYEVYSVPEAFTTEGLESIGVPPNDTSIEEGLLYTMAQQAQSNELQRLDSLACINAYTQVYQSTNLNLLLISEGNLTLISRYGISAQAIDNGPCGPFQAYQWACKQFQTVPPGSRECQVPCDALLPVLRANADNWTPVDPTVRVKYCLAQTFEEHCKLRLSPIIAWLVVGLNLVKVVLIFQIMTRTKEPPLLTLGDAVCSFLKHQDSSTSDMCLISKLEIADQPGLWTRAPRSFNAKPYRIHIAASRRRWLICISAYVLALLLCAILLIYGISQFKGSKAASDVFSLKLGAITASTVIQSTLPLYGSAALIGNSLMANSPQLILSFLYFTYNALFTAMASGREWSSFAHNRKGLRISTVPQGAQRSTYFLQLPYRYAIPLMLASGVLHWLMSQSIFVLSVDVYDSTGELYENNAGNFESFHYDSVGSFTTCGWSPTGVLAVISLGTCLVIWLLWTGSRRLEGIIPLAGSCSVAISSACHISGEPDGWMEELQWGVVNPAAEGQPGHCAFSSNKVEKPQPGCLYSGGL